MNRSQPRLVPHGTDRQLGVRARRGLLGEQHLGLRGRAADQLGDLGDADERRQVGLIEPAQELLLGARLDPDDRGRRRRRHGCRAAPARAERRRRTRRAAMRSAPTLNRIDDVVVKPAYSVHDWAAVGISKTASMSRSKSPRFRGGSISNSTRMLYSRMLTSVGSWAAGAGWPARLGPHGSDRSLRSPSSRWFVLPSVSPGWLGVNLAVSPDSEAAYFTTTERQPSFVLGPPARSWAVTHTSRVPGRHAIALEQEGVVVTEPWDSAGQLRPAPRMRSPGTSRRR